jgi:hypothetical protein
MMSMVMRIVIQSNKISNSLMKKMFKNTPTFLIRIIKKIKLDLNGIFQEYRVKRRYKMLSHNKFRKA